MVKLNVYNSFKTLTEQEIMEQKNEIVLFLSKVHPFLIKSGLERKMLYKLKNEGNAVSPAVEIRALRRDTTKDNTNRVNNSSMYCNLRLYSLEAKEQEKLLKFLTKLNNAKIPYCLYYSIYNFNSEVLAVAESTGNVAKEWNNKIAKNNSLSTQILGMDFDHSTEDKDRAITEEDFLQQKAILQGLGINTLDVFSGHGFHSLILLDKPNLDKDLQSNFTKLLLRKGFAIDSKIKDCARILRLPATFNSKDTHNLIKTYMYTNFDGNDTVAKNRYSAEDIFNKLESLPNVVEEQESFSAAALNVKEEKMNKETKKEVKIEKESTISTFEKFPLEFNDNLLQELYPSLPIAQFSNNIKYMLMGFRKGYANNMLIFLVSYFKQCGYTKSFIKEIMQILAIQDRYNYAWATDVVAIETDRFFYKSYSPGAIYLSELQKFGFMEFNLKDKSILTINNTAFKVLKDMGTQTFVIYLKMLLEENYNGTFAYTINTASSSFGVSVRRIQPHLQGLVDVKIMDKKRANRRENKEYSFYLSKFIDVNKGYTKINVFVLKSFLKMIDDKELNATQVAILLYLKCICYNNKDNCTITQEHMGDMLGLKQSTISVAFKVFENLQLIRREQEQVTDFKFKYNYIIHY